MKRVRAWLRAFGPVRLLDDCAALMMIETGDETEADLRRALEARPPLIHRLALRAVLRSVRRQQAKAALRGDVRVVVPEPVETPPPEELRRIA